MKVRLMMTLSIISVLKPISSIPPRLMLNYTMACMFAHIVPSYNTFVIRDPKQIMPVCQFAPFPELI